MSLPALLGGVPVADAGTYPSWPQWSEREREELLATLDSGAWWTGDGERAFRFARDFAQYQGAAAGYPFTNGTQTLEAALVACGVGEGDEVIVPGMTFVASASAVLAVNATPVIVDVDPETLCIDPAAAEAAIGERTRAIIAVHVAGAVCDLDLLVPLCERRGLHLIERGGDDIEVGGAVMLLPLGRHDLAQQCANLIAGGLHQIGIGHLGLLAGG